MFPWFKHTVIPEVSLTADRVRIIAGRDVTLTCNVTRGNPMEYTYEWTNVDSGTKLTETSAALTIMGFNIAEVTYRCQVTNDVGTGTDTITIGLGGQSLLLAWNEKRVHSICPSVTAQVQADPEGGVFREP